MFSFDFKSNRQRSVQLVTSVCMSSWPCIQHYSNVHLQNEHVLPSPPPRLAAPLFLPPLHHPSCTTNQSLAQRPNRLVVLSNGGTSLYAPVPPDPPDGPLHPGPERLLDPPGPPIVIAALKDHLERLHHLGLRRTLVHPRPATILAAPPPSGGSPPGCRVWGRHGRHRHPPPCARSRQLRGRSRLQAVQSGLCCVHRCSVSAPQTSPSVSVECGGSGQEKTGYSSSCSPRSPGTPIGSTSATVHLARSRPTATPPPSPGGSAVAGGAAAVPATVPGPWPRPIPPCLRGTRLVATATADTTTSARLATGAVLIPRRCSTTARVWGNIRRFSGRAQRAQEGFLCNVPWYLFRNLTCLVGGRSQMFATASAPHIISERQSANINGRASESFDFSKP